MLDPGFIIFVFGLGVFLTASGVAKWVKRTKSLAAKEPAPEGKESDAMEKTIEETERIEQMVDRLEFGGTGSTAVFTMILGTGLVLPSAALFLTWLVDRIKA